MVKKIIYLDMDGVLVNYAKAAYEAHNKEFHLPYTMSYSLYENWGMKEDEFWPKVSGYDFWRNIQPYSWSHQLIRSIVEDFPLAHLRICTTPGRDPECEKAKKLSLKHHFNIRSRDIIFTSDKWMLAQKGRLLIDDREENYSKFRNSGGEAILFPQPWNSNRDLIPQRLSYVGNLLNSFLAD